MIPNWLRLHCFMVSGLDASTVAWNAYRPNDTCVSETP
jgi:hypothetical protein